MESINKNLSFSKNKFVYLILVIVSMILFVLTIRGSYGVPTSREVKLELSESGQVYETSQERARYAQVLALYHDKSFNIDNYASMGTPDVGRIGGHYFSYFSPALSILAVPFYHIGLQAGSTQLLVFLLPVVISIMTMILIAKFALKLRLHWSVALFSALAFGFATNAWGYSVTLYVHILSAFLILAGLYLVSTLNEGGKTTKLLMIWAIYGLAVFADYPNLFVYLPIAALAFIGAFSFNDFDNKYSLRVQLKHLLTPLVFVVMIALYGLYNYLNFGNPLTLSNTLPRVRTYETQDLSVSEADKSGSSAVGALTTRNMLEGLSTFTFRLDRGILIYSPVGLLFIFGVSRLKLLNKNTRIGLISIPLVNLITYSMFGDPYGGWAFGSRYMIAIMPQLVLLAGLGLNSVNSSSSKVLYSLIFVYSSGVSLLAPLTSNVIPPKIEAEPLGLKSTYVKNIERLNDGELNSFLYNTYLSDYLASIDYYLIILGIVISIGLFVIWYPRLNGGVNKT